MRVIHEGAEHMGEQLSIGEFARRSWLSQKALRLYESEGLLVPERESNGYRAYDTDQLRDARVVRLLRRLDMPVQQVRAVLDARPQDQAELVDAYWRSVESRVIQQRSLVAHALETLSGRKEIHPMFEIQVRVVAEERVLTEQAHVKVGPLTEWISDAFSRQHGTGITSGFSSVIFHGEVNEDSDGPVEAITIIPADAESDLPTRVDPARREAFTRITKAQVAFPEILSAYDAVEAWIGANGYRQVGSPREVYFVDWMAVGDDDPACDIAFPIE